MASLQAPGEGAGFVVAAAEPHDLSGPAIHHMEKVTARGLYYHPESNHWLRPTYKPVQLNGGETGTLMQAVDDVAAHLDVRVHGGCLQGGVIGGRA
ncbi:hypothetical protein [Pseudomonas extremaustralis]|uniref:hypothetical protein n=1 Tax=Pseudomonas extremaustralis TaxID=359110 RepID=UPI002AA82E6D|nr:hypothetical protein [Pseudomonas extremaustralis]